MKILFDPTFWTLIAFILCGGVFGIKGFLFLKKRIEDYIIRIETCFHEAQTLYEEASSLLTKRKQENKELIDALQKIREKSDEDLKTLSQETDRKLTELLKRSEEHFQKRLSLLEEQAFLTVKQEIVECIYEESLHFLKNLKDKKAQQFFIQQALKSLPLELQISEKN